MASGDSVAQRALSLPELLRIIFLSMEEEKPTLAACMRVNKTWMNEAVRVLWATCGDIEDQAYPPLQVCDLVALKATPSRLQWYANFVQNFRCILSSKYTKTKSGWQRDISWRNPKSHDSRYLPQLKGVNFPRLKLVLLGPSFRGPNPNDPRLILQYLQPGLESLTVDTSYYSPKFFATLTAQCRSLRHLNLGCDDKALRQRSEEKFATFLLNSPTLKELSLHDGFQPWTEKIFRAVALHPSLYDLSSPSISEFWTLDATSNTFPSLQRLLIELTEKAFERLAPAIHNVPKLTLFLSGPCHQTMRTVLNFSGLRKLYIDVSCSAGFTIHGEDLLAVARNNPSLVELTCPMAADDVEDPLVSGVGFSDAIMDEVAACLPHLERFCIETKHNGTLTGETLLSFGRRCKRLEYITICADVFWEDFVYDGDDNMFPVLSCLKVWQLPSYESLYCQDVSTVVKGLRAMCPLLTDLRTDTYESYSGGPNLAEAWEEFCKAELQKEDFTGVRENSVLGSLEGSLKEDGSETK